MNASEVSTPNDTSVLIQRSFDAPARIVWRAYVEPELFARWCTALPGWTMPVCEMDVRPGGKYLWRWRSDEDGKEFGFAGEFREVVRPSRIVHVERFDPGDVGGEMGEALVTTELVEKNGITTQTMTIRYESKEVRDAALKTGMTDGMEMSYQKLDQVLAEQQA